jgi:secondary thiamine-phosphate synthase enzyme
VEGTLIAQKTLRFRTRGRGTTEITPEIEREVRASGVRTGTCNLFLQHTSASLIVSENADPSVRRDLETLLARLAPDGDAAYAHDTEGPDDMAAHARTVLTASSLVVPVAGGRLALGTWQGVYLWEHRREPHERSLIVTICGED